MYVFRYRCISIIHTRCFAPKDIVTPCLSTLTPLEASFIDDEFRQSHADKVFQVKTSCGKGYVSFIVEHQSTADEYMVIRMIEYMCKAVRYHLQQGNKHYPIVIPLLIYNGTVSPYPFSTDFFEYFTDPRKARELMLKPFPLVDLSTTSDDELLQNPLTAYPFLLMKHVQLNSYWIPIMKRVLAKHILRHLETIGKRHLVQNLLYFTQLEADIPSDQKHEFIGMLRDESKALGDTAMTLFEHAKKEGMQESSYLIAQNLLKKGLEPSLVSETTGLSSDIIFKLKEEVR